MGTHPSLKQKTSQASADIPITLLINTLQTAPRECVRPRVLVRAFYLFVLVEHLSNCL